MSTSVKSERLLQRCPGCSRLLRIPAELKGQQVACKFCEQVMVVESALHVEGTPPVAAAPRANSGHRLSHVGTGTAFQIQHTWSAGRDKESHYTVIKHPLAQPLRGYTMAVECIGPSRVHMAGIKVADGRSTSLGRVEPGEAHLVPLDELHHAYLWLDKGTTATVKVIVTRLLVLP